MIDKLLELIVRRFKLLLALTTLGLISFVGWRFSLVSVQVSGYSTDPVIEAQVHGQTAQKLRPGLNIVRTGHYVLRVSDRDKLTEQATQSQALHLTRVHVPLQAQQNARKISGNSLGCMFGGAASLTAASSNSYSCNGRTKLFHHSFVDQPQRTELQHDYVYGAVPYSDGILAFTNPPGGVNIGLDFINETSRLTTSFSTLLNSDISDLTIVPLQTGQTGDSGFVVLNRQTKQLQRFSSLADKLPASLNLKSAGDTTNTSYDISATTGKIYVVVTTPKADTPATPSDNPHGSQVQLRLYNPSSLHLDNTIALATGSELGQLQPLGSDRLVNHNLKGDLDIYRLNGQKLVLENTIYQASRPVTGPDRLIYSRNKDLFSYQPANQTSQLIYRFDQLLPSSVQLLQGQVVLGTAVPNAGLLHNFVLTTQATNPRNLEKVLSYAGSGDDTSYTDFNSNIIYAELKINNITSERSTGQIIYDPAEVTTKRNNLRQRLLQDGIDLTKYKLVFNP